MERYIQIQAVNANGELIPFWDKRLKLCNSSDTGLSIKFNGDEYHGFVQCTYDLKEKTLTSGVKIDCYEEKVFQEGESVYYETDDYQCLAESKIKSIVFNNYDLHIRRGKDVKDYEIEDYIKDNPGIVIEKAGLYSIKHWKPTYVLENGMEIEYSHQLYHKAK